MPHTYPDEGTFTIMVTVSDGTDQDSVTLFGVDPSSVDPTSLDAAATIEQIVASHTYSEPGTYDTEVCALDGDGGRGWANSRERAPTPIATCRSQSLSSWPEWRSSWPPTAAATGATPRVR